tara:strand:+ start:824 stop:1111 length:288 start_codon:yes stop_codon:yes gene_type:complete
MIYAIIQFNIKDEEVYKEYSQATGKIIMNYGAKPIAAAKTAEFILGSQTAKNKVIVAFPTKQHVEDWLNSAEYAPYIPLRDKALQDLSISILNEF